MKLLVRFLLMGLYLIVTVFLTWREYLYPDYSSLPLTFSPSQHIQIALLMPWNLLFYALIGFLHIEGNLLPFLADLASLVINAYILYRIGNWLERVR